MITVGLIYDTPNWALHNIAASLKKYQPEGITFHLFSYADLLGGKLKQADIDLKYANFSIWDTPLDRKYFVKVADKLKLDLVWVAHEDLCRAVIRDNLHTVRPFTFAMLDPIVWAEGGVGQYQKTAPPKKQFADMAAISCGVNAMHKAGSDCLSRYLRVPVHLTHVGVDTDIFAYRQLEPKHRISVGICADIDMSPLAWRKRVAFLKGLPASCSNAGVEVDWVFRSRRQKALSYRKMADWYYKCDIVICASVAEGGPMPLIEAAGCGRAIITTPVGCMPELLGPQYMVEDMALFVPSIARMATDRMILARYAAYSYECSKRWTWDIKINQWKEFFQAAYAYSTR